MKNKIVHILCEGQTEQVFVELPSTFPNYGNSLSIPDKYQRIEFLEKSFAQYENESRFIPYIQLHEFEALVFCGLDYLPEKYPGCEKRIKPLKDELAKTGNPELINNNPNSAPSKRIIKAIEGNKDKAICHYNKPMTGKYITERVGIELLRGMCPHFNEWIEKIIQA